MTRDKDIREPLFDFLECKYGRIRILEELMMGRSRADVVMVTTNSIFGIEIKSDADTYARLGRQVRDYDKYYDYNIVVVGARHAYHIEEHVPDYWGIVVADEENDNLDFYMLREPKNNPKVTWKKKLTFLWRPELVTIQELNKMPKYREKSKSFVVDKIISMIPDKISEEVLSTQLSDVLFERDYTTIAAELEEYRRAHG